MTYVRRSTRSVASSPTRRCARTALHAGTFSQRRRQTCETCEGAGYQVERCSWPTCSCPATLRGKRFKPAVLDDACTARTSTSARAHDRRSDPLFPREEARSSAVATPAGGLGYLRLGTGDDALRRRRSGSRSARAGVHEQEERQETLRDGRATGFISTTFEACPCSTVSSTRPYARLIEHNMDVIKLASWVTSARGRRSRWRSHRDGSSGGGGSRGRLAHGPMAPHSTSRILRNEATPRRRVVERVPRGLSQCHGWIWGRTHR